MELQNILLLVCRNTNFTDNICVEWYSAAGVVCVLVDI